MRKIFDFDHLWTYDPSVSLNSSERQVFDYLQGKPDEARFWREKVRAIAALTGDNFAAAARLDRELWRYAVERSSVMAAFGKFVQQGGGSGRTSMLNLAELLLRLWIEPRSKKPPIAGSQDSP